MSPFVQSEAILDLIAQSKLFLKTPAELLFIDDEYTAYCLNQACAYIRVKIEQEKQEPRFIKKHKSFTELYAQFDN